MKENSEIKTTLLYELQLQLQNKIRSVQQSIVSAKESRDGDSKNSAGDKHETARAMVQIEIDNQEQQLQKLTKLFNDLAQTDITRMGPIAEPGCLVYTTSGNYFLSIGWGKISITGHDYFILSIASPVGALLLGKSAGESFVFQGKEVFVEKVC